MEQFWLLRIEFPMFDATKFQESIDMLMWTQYKLSARDEDAPWVTHCVSAVRYVIERATGYTLPHMYIGNMCRRILDAQVFPSRILPLDYWETWDLIFFRWRTRLYNSYMVTHVWILLDDEYFFHSTLGRWWVTDNISGAVIQSNIASCDIMTRLTDPRSK